MRLGIFGGSFDPVHHGHLGVARVCQRQALLDEVWFTPVARQPLKHAGPRATSAQRVEMLRRAIDFAAGEPSEPGGPPPRPPRPTRPPRPRSSWRVCTLEIDRGGFSYTVDTLRQIHEELPEAELFFLVGADTLRDVPQWKEPAEIFRLATPLVVGRAGQPGPDLTEITSLCRNTTQPRLIEMPEIDVSSSEVRRRLAAGESIDELVPPPVAHYIYAQGLYR